MMKESVHAKVKPFGRLLGIGQSARVIGLTVVVTLLCSSAVLCAEPAGSPLSVAWKDGFLSIRGSFPGGEVRICYLEAYCRAGSTDRDWSETVIGHKSRLVAASPDGKFVRLLDTLDDGVLVRHTISAGKDEIDFRLEAHNPTGAASEADWAQPCMRVDRFTGRGHADARARVPAYARQCFIFLGRKLTRLPTEPWAESARYVPGQVYCPPGVNRADVNPRPLSRLVPSCGLVGCFSADGRQILATAWEPYQELFQGVIACIHSDFRIGGLEPGERKRIHGKLYIVPADVDALVVRYRRDFPEQAGGLGRP
ncbi:MAG: hypothetical protein ACC645_17540 [Pirellulales bacterium]